MVTYWTTNSLTTNLVEFVTPFLKLVTFIYVALIFYFARRKDIHSSGLLFTFWFLLAISFIIILRSLLMNSVSLEKAFILVYEELLTAS